MLHLYHSVLAPEDVAAKYGPKENVIQTATTEDLIHNAHARPTRLLSVPWDYEVSFFSTGEVDRTLGAHRDVREPNEPQIPTNNLKTNQEAIRATITPTEGMPVMLSL